MIEENGKDEDIADKALAQKKPEVAPAPAAQGPRDPFINQRDPRIPSELSLTEKFMTWSGRHPWLTVSMTTVGVAAAAGIGISTLGDVFNWDSMGTGFLTVLGTIFAGAAGGVIGGCATEAGNGFEKDHRLTLRAARFDRLANRAAQKGKEGAEHKYRQQATFERKARSGSHEKTRYIVGPDRMPLERFR